MNPPPYFTYKNDDFMGDLLVRKSSTLLAAAGVSFIVISRPMLHLQECDITLDKWHKLHVSHHHILLGLVWDTRLMIGRTVNEYHAEVLAGFQVRSHICNH